MLRTPLLLATLILAAPLVAYADGDIRGKVVDRAPARACPPRTSRSKAARNADRRDRARRHVHARAPPGTYTIVFSTPEYVEQTRTVTVDRRPGRRARSQPRSRADVAGKAETIEIVDTIDTRKESAVLAVRRAASTVSDAVSSQEIARTPDSNAGDAMKRVVAVTRRRRQVRRAARPRGPLRHGAAQRRAAAEPRAGSQRGPARSVPDAACCRR